MSSRLQDIFYTILMKLNELKTLLSENSTKQFLLKLPNEKDIPHSFHITEVGLISKTFVDCGGKVHTLQICQLQAWIGPDIDHKIEASKMTKILKLSEQIVPNEQVDVEIEYEEGVISQYPILKAVVSDSAVTLYLTTKHTDCLAKDICLPQIGSKSSCCEGGGCC